MDFVVLSSSRGTVFEATLKAIESKALTATCLGLISDHGDRGCVEKAKQANIPVVIVERKKGEDRERYDKSLDTAITSLMPPPPAPPPGSPSANRPGEGRIIVACMGWMWLLSPWFVKKWHGKILNVHPSLLPKYPGTHAHAEVLAAKEKESGMTIHIIDEGLDSGNILIQKTCPVLPNDSEETLKARVQQLECEWYPKVLGMIARGELRL